VRVLRAANYLWTLLGITLLMLWVLDGACDRIVRSLTHQQAARDTAWAWTQDPDFGAQTWGDLYRAETARALKTRWEPLVHWRCKPFKGELINIDERGLRRTLNNATTTPRLQVAMFGGSTLWGAGARDAHTIASELAALFAQEGIPAEITNFAESGYVQTQEMITLQRALQTGYRPDLAIFYNGVNDVYAAYQSGVAGFPQNAANRRNELKPQRPKLGEALRAKLADSGILRLILHLKFGNQPILAPDDRRPKDPRPLMLEVLRIYRSNIAMIDAIAKEFGFQSVHFWQPVIYSKTPLSPAEKAIVQQDPQLKEVFELAYQLIAADPLCQHERFINLSAVLNHVNRSVFYDFCHASESANRIIAQAMLAHLKRLKLIHPPAK